MKQIDVKEFISAMDELEKERGISKDYLVESLEAALVTAYKKNFDSVDNVKVTIDSLSGEIHVYAVMDVVEESEDPLLEISLKDAQKINKKAKVGETVDVEIIPKDFGRIAAQTAKQVVVQKIREIERDMVFNEYNDKKGEIVSGLVQKADSGSAIIVDLGKLEGIMPMKEQIPTEKYKVNDKIRGYVMSVEKGAKGNPQAIISRSHPDFVRRLFELEIPEIYEGLIEVKSVSRDPGNRSKVAVYSKNENIDPVGSCVGQKGVRIQNIINELNGEKIDVIEWSEEPAAYIAASLLPAQVLAVDVKEEEKFAQVIVPDDQLSLAIGKSGQNARLAARLTSWKIDIKSESQFREMLMKAQEEEENEEVEEAEELVEAIEEPVLEAIEEKAEAVVEEKPKRGRKKKEVVEEVAEEPAPEAVEEEKPKKRGRKKKVEEQEEE
ncbi:MAG: transcription termination/antitermination protein NusA [Clostridia bacterium]|nr:transcription termination/antitermination protein NusA [Clostridia bacterium]